MKSLNLTALLLAAATATAAAQQADIEVDSLETIAVAPPAEPAEALSSSEPAQLEEIVVTAQKRSQSLQEVPISVTALDGGFIRETGAADLADVALYVPNVRVDADDLGSPQLFIRGFGTNAFNPSFESSVGFVQDDIFYGRPGYFTESMYDVDRVEVLRGPQGTLFGKNTIAGVFNVTTKNPTDTFSSDGRVTYGSFNTQRIDAGAGGMFADWGGARVAGLYRKEDGQLRNTFLNRDEEALEQKAARLKFRLFPFDSVTSDLMFQASDTSAPFWPYQLFKLDDDTRGYLEAFDAGVEDNPTNFRTQSDTAGFINKGSQTLGLRTQWAIGDIGSVHNSNAVLVLAGSRFHINQLNELDVSPADIARLDSHEHHEQLSAELRFAGETDTLFGFGDKVEFVAGGFVYDSRYQLRASINAGADIGSYLLTRDFCQLAGLPPGICGDGSNVSLPGLPIFGDITAPLIGPDNYAFDYLQDTLSIAGFGQATWHITERWAVTPGVRINREQKDVDSRGTPNCRLAVGDNPPCVISTLLMANAYDQRGLQRNEFDVSPKLVLQYFADTGVNLYGSYARGYKSGGFNSLSYTGEDLEFRPETADTFELGAKSEFFDRTLRFNATLYRTKFTDLQVLAFNGVFFDVSNAASATSQGLEGDFLWLTPWQPLQISGSFGLLDATYDDYRDAPAPVRDANGNLQIGALQDLSGKRIAFAPRQTASLTPQLSFPLPLGLGGRLAGDVIYQGDQFTDADLDPNTFVPAYTIYNARLTIANDDESLSLTIGGTNLGDKRVLNQVIDATFFPGTYFAQQANGRQLFVAIAAQF